MHSLRTLAALATLALLAPGASAQRIASRAAGAPSAHQPSPRMTGEREADMDMVAERREPAPPPPRRSLVKKALAKQRARHLAALRAYRKKGKFAHDLDSAGEVYVWRDADGHLDAVAAIMAADGKTFAAAVDANAPSLVGVHLSDLGYGDVHAWTMTSGFSAEEIDRLQRPHTRPTIVREGDDAWRTDEDARLAKAYGAVESYLGSHQADGLDAATDALMLQPALAWHLVDPKRAVNPPVRPMIPEPRRPHARSRR